MGRRMCFDRDMEHGTEGRAMRHILAAALLVGAFASPFGAVAQPNPNSQQIIDALRPNPLGGGTRGIRPVAPGGQAADPGTQSTAVPAPMAQQPGLTPGPAPVAVPVAPPSVNLTVTFATGSAELTPQAVRTLDELGRALASSDLSGFRFRVEGHTDTVGSAAANQALSERRAATVVRFLMGKYGIPPNRLEAIGMGEAAPMVPTGDEVPEPRNRRVQVVNLGA
jgi:OOP family OmpA-OmpF porin